MISPSTLLLIGASFFVSDAFAAAADPLAVAIVKQQFVNAKIVPDAVPVFSPVGTVQLNFASSVGIATVGQAIAKEDTSDAPAILTAGVVNGSTQYTGLLMDANYVGSSNPGGYNLHFLQNSFTAGTDSNGTLSLTGGSSVIPWAGPGPASGSGAHRYTFLVFAQPSDFAAPSIPKANSGVNLFDLNAYVTAAKLSGPIAGTYFTVEVGTATVEAGATTSVDPATLSVASSTASGSSSLSGSKSGTATSTSATATKSTNDAGKGVVASGMLGVAVFVVGVLAL